MNGNEFSKDIEGPSPETKTPDPAFLKQDHDFRKPLGLEIEKRQKKLDNENRGPRLSRQELETLLDIYYARNDGIAVAGVNHQHHAAIAGGRMVRNLALVSSLALLLGFAVGFYSLSQHGGETPLGQKFNSLLNGLWHQASQSQSSLDTAPTGKQAEKQPVSVGGKPIKTASLVVADATGSVHAGIPLKLSLKSDSKVDLVEVKILNVPADAVLTAGKRRSDGVWVLQPADLENVALVMSTERQSPLRLDIELVEARTGHLLSPIRVIKVAFTAPKPFKVGGL